MKKYFFICLLLLALAFVKVSAVSRNSEISNLNSKDLLTYLKWEEKRRPYKICNIDYCDYLKSNNLEKSVQIFINDYLDFLKEKIDEETSIKVSLQGFKITNIYYRY